MLKTSRLVSQFCQMVRISSESGNESKFAQYILNQAELRMLKNWQDGHGNVYIEVPGKGDPLMLNTHMDTVSPGVNIRPQIVDGFLKSDGTTVLGADSKAGIAAMFEVIDMIHENSLSNRPFTITLNRNEESGIPTAPMINSNIKECIVADRGTPIGEVIYKAPYAQVFQVNIKGKSAYATTSFQKGHHAILAACEMIQNLPIGNYDQFSTSNIGLIKGGVMTTTIPEDCWFKGNCYSFNEQSLNYFLDELKRVVRAIDKKYKTHSEIEMLEYFGGYALEKSDPLVKYAALAVKNSGITPRFKVYKAVTNANNLNQIGIKTVLLSTGVENQHTVREQIAIKTLEQLTQVVLNLVKANN